MRLWWSSLWPSHLLPCAALPPILCAQGQERVKDRPQRESEPRHVFGAGTLPGGDCGYMMLRVSQWCVIHILFPLGWRLWAGRGTERRIQVNERWLEYKAALLCASYQQSLFLSSHPQPSFSNSSNKILCDKDQGRMKEWHQYGWCCRHDDSSSNYLQEEWHHSGASKEGR